MQLVGGWPDGPRICLYMPHILYLGAKLFEQCSSLVIYQFLDISLSYAVIQHAIRPDLVISVIYPSQDIYSPQSLLVNTRLAIATDNEPTPPTCAYLGPLATAGDAERLDILLSLQRSQELDQVLLRSDS